MDELSVLVAIVLAILAMLVGYGIYSATVTGAENSLDKTKGGLDFSPTKSDSWPTSFRCDECYSREYSPEQVKA